MNGPAALRRGVVLALAVGLLVVIGATRHAAQVPPSFETSALTIVLGDDRRHDFAVEVARTPDQLAYGLMFRQRLAANAGMLFDYRPPQPVSMWMKNTMIPLDMLFVDAAGRIVQIAQRAVPHSTALIASDGPVRAVLELNGGTVARLGIAVGDRLRHPIFAAVK